MPNHRPLARRKPAPPYGYYMKLSPEERSFVDEYLIDLNAAAAATRAGYKDPTQGYQLLNRDTIQRAISERREMLVGDRGSNGALFVLNKLWNVATADPRELAEYRRIPCRFCWGINHQYQYTQTEMDRLLKAHEYGASKIPLEVLWPRGPAEHAAYMAGQHELPFDSQGGAGYTIGRSPNRECSECGGVGIGVHYIADTRDLSTLGRQLYRGLKVGKDKVEVLLADQEMARNMLARHYGVAVERKEVFVRNVDPRSLSEDELNQAIAELEALTLDREDYHVVDQRSNGEDTDYDWRQTTRQRRQANAAKARAARTNKPIHRPLYKRPSS